MERLIMQSDWSDVLNENSTESVWVQFKFSNDPAINGKLYFISTDNSNKQQTDNLFSIKKISNENKTIRIGFKSSQFDVSRKFVAPVAKFRLHFDPKTKKELQVLSLDVTDGGLGVSSTINGGLLVWLTENGQVRRVLQGHVGDVNVCKFFPSGLVVLSGSDDLRIKVWSVEDGSNPVTLTGHTRGVNDVSIIERGRNIVSVSRDGFCKLFDIGESKCISDVAKFDTIINCCSLSNLSEQNMNILNIPEREEALNEREVGTENKILCLACEDGFLRVVSLRARKTLFEFNCESSVNCCCFLNETIIACGTQNGSIFIYDLIEKKLESWREMRSSILSMKKFASNNSFIATTADGSCLAWNFTQADPIIELTGSNFDPVYSIAFNSTHIFTGCRDGFIRKYSLNHLKND